MKTRNTALAVLSLALVWTGCEGEVPPAKPMAAVDANDWPWWRGQGQDGKSRDAKAPTKWSADENIVWKQSIPGRGHSSPIVWGDRIFLTTADEQAQTQSVLGFDRKTGKVLSEAVVHKGGLMRKHTKNSHASAT